MNYFTDFMVTITPLAENFFALFTADPFVIALQIFLGILAAGLVFLVFLTTRDVLLRSQSLLFQLACILMVAILPVVGFLFYVLIRPSTTLKQRRIEHNLQELMEILNKKKLPMSFATHTQKSPNARIVEKKKDNLQHKRSGNSRISATKEEKSEKHNASSILQDVILNPSTSSGLVERKSVEDIKQNQKKEKKEPTFATSTF